MSLIISTSLCTFVNNTGLKMQCILKPTNSLRLHETFTNNVESQVQQDVSWVTEWIYLIMYGSLQEHIILNIEARKEAKLCLYSIGPIIFQCKWTDPSVSWKKENSGSWSIELQSENNIVFQAKFKGYTFKTNHKGPKTVDGVELVLTPKSEHETTVIELPKYIMHYRKKMMIDDICSD